ncbi:hypothetical protein OG455_37055 [Kitasatospora sp. NBC_01287]|nr:hypothetical protein [Kitasatospora sp. NBC_01287]MCX4751049.1 hypothetical protein [Kitasatospora sp. NBC_01287]
MHLLELLRNGGHDRFVLVLGPSDAQERLDLREGEPRSARSSEWQKA